MTIQNDTTKVGSQGVSVQDAAIQLLSRGFSVIPTNADKTPAIRSWKQYQKQAMSVETAKKVFRNGCSIALVGGSVSGNLECLDFDKPDLFKPFLETLGQQSPQLAAKLPKRGTPSGGYHLPYRCESRVGGSKKLAMSKKYEEGSQTKQDTWIETKGEGGYFISPPSPGYAVIEHSLKDIPVLTAEEVALLHTIARSLTATLDKVEAPKEARVDGVRPGDDFNERVDPSEILPKHGWKRSSKTGSGGEHWTRPGKDKGTSATLKDGCLYVFSTSTVLPVGPRSAFSIYAHYEHDGNFTEAARALAKEGYGYQKNQGWSPGLGNIEVIDNNEPWEPGTPDWPVLDSKALPGIAGEFVGLATENSEADPAAVLTTFLVRFGVEVGSGPRMMVGDTPHRCRLASVIVGATSKARKGTSGKPVNRLFSAELLTDSDRPYIPAQTTAGPFSSGEGIIHLVRDEIREWDKKDQAWIVTDPGIEDKRLFILDEEFAGVLANTKREGNTLSMTIRQMWDNGNLAPIIRHKRNIATGAHIGWVAHITTYELNKRLDVSEAFNGFANRILWVCAERKILVPWPEPMDKARLAPMQHKIFMLVRKMGGDIEISPDSEAKAAWSEQYYPELTRSKPGLVGSIVNRAEAQVLRLAMIYALLDGSSIFTLKNLESAIAFWNYCEQSAEYIFHGREADNVAQKILGALEGGQKTATHIHSVFNNHVSRERLETALSELLAAGTIIRFKVNTKGRPITWFKLAITCEKSEKSEKRVA